MLPTTASAAVFVGVYLLTSVVMDRPLTSELLYVMIWAAAELSSLRVAQASGLLAGGRAVAAFAVILLALLTGLVCYSVYYLLAGHARFLAGLLPYAAVSLAMLVAGILLLLLLVGKRRSNGVA